MAGICPRSLFSGIYRTTCLMKESSLSWTVTNIFGGVCNIPCRGKTRVLVIPKMKYPLWHLKKEHAKYVDTLTAENIDFVKEVTHEKYGPPAIKHGVATYDTPSPVRGVIASNQTTEWTPKTRRCGLITRKIGQYPMWLKNGKIIWTTLLQVADNHVIKYTPPEEYDPPRKPLRFLRPIKYGCLVVGAESQDPQRYTREYSGLFAEAGLPPKKVLTRFLISPSAVIQPGTPLSALHFTPGSTVDVSAISVDRGFQGVMKRWGFAGMPATHGVTKSHRRGGNTGSGGNKARKWKGTKIPGLMGNVRRHFRGLKVWRVNTKYNVLYVQGMTVPGPTNGIVYVYDTLLPRRRSKEPPKYFPTYFPNEEEDLPEDLYDEEVQPFDSPSITFQPDK